MRVYHEDTPPSSISGDEINAVDDINGIDDDDEVIYLGELDEYPMEDDDMDQIDEDEDMEPPEDLSSLVFSKHVGSVFCCDLHPNGKLAVTGGEDDKAYVWSVTTGEIRMDCVGHKDSVIFVGFSHDGAYLATVDMGGMIKVWKTNDDEKQNYTISFEYECDDVIWGTWHFGTRVLICGTASGDIYIFKIPSGDTKILQGHNVKTECGKLFQDGTRLVAAYEDGSVKIWDLKTSNVLQHISASVHEMRVTAVDTHPENNLIASISADGKVVLTTSSNGKIVNQFEVENDLETVMFSPDVQTGYLALGTLNGAVSIWDFSRQMLRHNCSKPDESGSCGVTKIIWVNNFLVTGCLDGSIRVYEGRSGVRSSLLTGHRSEILDFCYNSKENIILTTSDDSTARIFKCELSKEND